MMAKTKRSSDVQAPVEAEVPPAKPKRLRKPTKTGPALRGEDVPNPIADLFRCKIRESGLSMADVARQSGIDYSVVFRYMRGERELNGPSYHQLLKLFNGRIVFEDSHIIKPARTVDED